MIKYMLKDMEDRMKLSNLSFIWRFGRRGQASVDWAIFDETVAGVCLDDERQGFAHSGHMMSPERDKANVCTRTCTNTHTRHDAGGLENVKTKYLKRTRVTYKGIKISI